MEERLRFAGSDSSNSYIEGVMGRADHHAGNAFSDNHQAGTIEMRKGTTQGQVLHSFSNATPVQDVVTIFRAL